MPQPYYVEFITWNTDLASGNQGLERASNALNYGSNLGHASMEISFPYTEETQGWVNQYCRNIQLYSPPESHARQEKDKYVVEVPVYYTTLQGTRIDNPEQYRVEHPEEPIVTHVYLSWVPGDYAAQRDERDPFGGVGKRSFSLYTAKQDRIMEHAGDEEEFHQGYSGIQQIELRDSGEIEGTGKTIIRGTFEHLHHLTPEEIRYYSLTPGQRIFKEKNVKAIGKILKQLNNEALAELKQSILHYIQENKNASANELYIGLCGLNEKINPLYDLYFKVYLKKNGIDEDDVDAILEEEIAHQFIHSGLPYMLEGKSVLTSDLKIIQDLNQVNFFIEIMDDLEKNHSDIASILENIEDIKDDLDDDKIEELKQQYPIIKILLEKMDSKYDMDDETYIEDHLEDDLEDYVRLRTYLQSRRDRTSVGISADSRVIVPISPIEDHAGHPQGLNVEKMLQEVKKVVEDGEGYALRYKNCSDFVQAIAKAGAVEPIRTEFDRHALGYTATPQVVANGALYAYMRLSGLMGNSPFRNAFVAQEKKTAELYKEAMRLEERIKAQDEIIDDILKNKKEAGNEIAQALLESVLELFPNREKLLQDNVALKKAIYAYCNDRYHQNIESDKERLYSEIRDNTGLYALLSERDPSLFFEQNIKSKMGSLYSFAYGDRPFWEKSRLIQEDFQAKGPLYMRACHTIIYENAPGTANLMDPNFQSMEEERKSLKQLNRKIVRNRVGLLLLREITDIFANTSGITDPWYEIKFLLKQINTYIEALESKNTSRFITTGVQVGKYLSVGVLGAIHGILVVPRRSISSFVNRIRNSSVFKFGTREKTNSEQIIDYRFAQLSGKVTSEELIKQKMREMHRKSLSLWERIKLSEARISQIIDLDYRTQGPLYENVIQGTTIIPEEWMSKTRDNLHHYQEKEKALLGTSTPVVELTEQRLNQAFRHAKEHYEHGRIPIFNHTLIDKVLHQSRKLETSVALFDLSKTKDVPPSLTSKLVQFRQISMALLGEEKSIGGYDIDEYDPQRDKPIIPLSILQSNDEAAIKAFFIQRINEITEKAEALSSMIPTEEEINQCSLSVLKSMVFMVSASSYSHMLKSVEKRIVADSLQNKGISVLDCDVNAFKVLLVRYGLDSELISHLEQHNLLPKLLVKLQYTECCAKSMHRIERDFGHHDLPKTPSAIHNARARKNPLVSSATPSEEPELPPAAPAVSPRNTHQP